LNCRANQLTRLEITYDHSKLKSLLCESNTINDLGVLGGEINETRAPPWPGEIKELINKDFKGNNGNEKEDKLLPPTKPKGESGGTPRPTGRVVDEVTTGKPGKAVWKNPNKTEVDSKEKKTWKNPKSSDLKQTEKETETKNKEDEEKLDPLQKILKGAKNFQEKGFEIDFTKSLKDVLEKLK